MINLLSNLINRNRSAAKVSQVLCSTRHTVNSTHQLALTKLYIARLILVTPLPFCLQYHTSYLLCVKPIR